jgi:hypothetical protein
MNRVAGTPLVALIFSFLFVALTGCANPTLTSPSVPAITSFTANPTAVNAGGMPV